MHSNRKLRIWCLLGLFLSLYATYVEIQLILDKDYKALCDLAPKLSCTAVFNSPYGKSFGFLNTIFSETTFKWNPPNGIFGLIYYSVLFSTTFINRTSLLNYQLLFCILSNIMSIYLAYLLYILENICVVCISIYVVNILCLWEIYKYVKRSKIEYLNATLTEDTSKKID